ncbi:UDP-3-O-(3-hydroxymyristoyl)glucosamine N-acyltransferase [Hellea balneolensis]|uniref:UDP-3-O-(3-hydroxymyristoyl)glucosamine N-acyltransferase n=1 Tax=Hellea balneolensis TaxID=287478 RepID=UPI0003FAAC6C|nr:UDP-3-O-(3-hydroxymyristoyl)glucosamine N-acyltransferase [Hellea balneolensis]
MIDTRFYISRGPLSLGDLIQGLEAELPHAKFSDEEIASGAILAESLAAQISFLENKRHKDQALTAKATACFVTDRLAEIIGSQHIIPIVTKTPRAHFARAMERLASPKTLSNFNGSAKIAKSANIHSSAIVGAGAVIEDSVEIAPYTVIGPGVHIKAGTVIGSHVDIRCALIGQNCKIKSSSVIGGAGFGVARDENGMIDIPHLGRVIIKDRVSIGSQSCVDRGQIGDTVIEDDVKIDNLVQIAHNCSIGTGTVIAGHTGISGSCNVGKGVQMGGNVGLADHLSVGDGASIAARAGVMHDIPAGEVWSGIPAMPIRDHMRVVNATRKLIQKPKRDT